MRPTCRGERPIGGEEARTASEIEGIDRGPRRCSKCHVYFRNSDLGRCCSGLHVKSRLGQTGISAARLLDEARPTSRRRCAPGPATDGRSGGAYGNPEAPMLRILCWIVIIAAHAEDVREPSDRFGPPGWRGNPWGPAASRRDYGQPPDRSRYGAPGASARSRIAGAPSIGGADRGQQDHPLCESRAPGAPRRSARPIGAAFDLRFRFSAIRDELPWVSPGS